MCDCIYGWGEWNGVFFLVIDIGGYVYGLDDIFEGEICKQVEIVIEEVDVIFFVVDVIIGIVDLDEIVVGMLCKVKKKVMVIVNKVDNIECQGFFSEFWLFGLGDVFDFLVVNGFGIGEILDEVIKGFDKEDKEVEVEEEFFKIVVIGKLNVGKLFFINVLIGEE